VHKHLIFLKNPKNDEKKIPDGAFGILFCGAGFLLSETVKNALETRFLDTLETDGI
jgi:hypothetical protein